MLHRPFRHTNSLASEYSNQEPWQPPLYAPGLSTWTPNVARNIVGIHDASLRRENASFVCTLNSPILSIWRGKFRPLSREYELEIRYSPGFATNQFQIKRRAPEVRILVPNIKPDNAVGIPHLYEQPSDGINPHLCLYWPLGEDWHDLERDDI